MSLVPAHENVRALLVAAEEGRGDVALAAEALQAEPGRDDVPGLTFRVLGVQGRRSAQSSEQAAACAVVQGLAKGPLKDVALLHVAACAPTRELLLEVSRGPFRHHPEALRANAALVKNASQGARRGTDDADLLLGPALEAPIPLDDAPQRQAVAAALGLLATTGSEPVARKAVRRLLDELPEQPAVGTDADAGLPARRVARGAVLEKLHDNDAVVALLQDLVGKDCEASLLVGKAQRKLRHYQAARVALAAATGPTCGESRKKAQYLEARVARVQNAGSADPLLSAFVKEHGADPLVDDVLLWLSEVRAGKGDAAGALKALQSIVDDHKDGDMADEARFRLGLTRARQGQTAEALKLLDDAVTALQAPAKRKKVDLLDRARYWRLRLAVFPDVESLTPAKTVTDADKAALAKFAADRGASFYGLVAARSLVLLGLTAPTAGDARAAAADSVPLPAALSSEPRFALAQRALLAGFDDDAAWLLERIVDDLGATSAGDDDVVFGAAALFTQVGRPDLGHQTLRNAGLALLGDAPRGDALVRWSLSWPRAFAPEIEAAAAAQKIPAPLLMGLAREESAFTHDVVSWAGAIGLCQLMPPTAKDEALALKKPAPATADLLDPRLNALLGAAHLGRRLRGMSHPLLAIGAYNAGPGGVAKWLPPKGTRRPLDIFVEDIPVDETRGYIKKVTGSWQTYATLDGGADVAFDLWIRG